MAREWENFCVGCPQGCINCGRKHDVLIITCDFCDDQIEYDDPDDVLKFGNGLDMCRACHDNLEENLMNIDMALQELRDLGIQLHGDDGWKERLKAINDALAGLEAEV